MQRLNTYILRSQKTSFGSCVKPQVYVNVLICQPFGVQQYNDCQHRKQSNMCLSEKRTVIKCVIIRKKVPRQQLQQQQQHEEPYQRRF